MKTVIQIGLVLAAAAGAAHADTLALVAADNPILESNVQQAMMATGKFTSVDVIDTQNSTPDLATLSAYTDILVWTDAAPADRVGLGNVLASYYDLGGKHLTIANYAFSTIATVKPFNLPDPELQGTIASAPYAALINAGVNGDVSGELVPVVSNDPIFTGLDPTTLYYFENQYFAHPTLAAGATLIAADGSGSGAVALIARSQNGVVNLNFYPAGSMGEELGSNSTDFFTLLANSFLPVPPPSDPPTVNSGCIADLSAAATGERIRLTWSKAGARRYDIYRSTTSGSGYQPLGWRPEGATHYVDRSVTEGTTYYYVVREATAKGTETCQSNEASATAAEDKTAPTTTARVLPDPNAQGWSRSNVMVVFEADDHGGSGVKQISISWTGADSGSRVAAGRVAAIQLGTEGTTTVTYFSTDEAGNNETPKMLTVMIDKTAPTVTATLNPPPDSNGLSDSSVTVTFTGTDSLSGVQSCTAPVTLNPGGSHTAKGVCTDNAGNRSAPLVVNVKFSSTATSSGVH